VLWEMESLHPATTAKQLHDLALAALGDEHRAFPIVPRAPQVATSPGSPSPTSAYLSPLDGLIDDFKRRV
jgi:hypothetical protein